MKRPDFSKIKTATLRGKVFNLVWRRPPKRKTDPKNIVLHGLCDHPSTPQKEIWLHPDKDSKELLGTVIHECTHGDFPDLEEDAVRAHEQSIMRLLTRMGIKVEFHPR